MIKIRKTDDLQAVIELDREIFAGDILIQEKELGACEWWLAYDGETPVAFAGIWPLPEEGKAFLAKSGVIKAYRGSGLQKRLIRVRMSYAKEIGLYRCYTYIWAGNHASMRSLISCGLRPYYFGRSENASWLYFETCKKRQTPV